MSDRSKYSSALPWFRIVLKQRDFASFGRMGIAIERAGETAGLPSDPRDITAIDPEVERA